MCGQKLRRCGIWENKLSFGTEKGKFGTKNENIGTENVTKYKKENYLNFKI